MAALEELLTAWRRNPSAELTAALCGALGSSGRQDLIREVGASAETWHAQDASVMVALGRMYLEAGLITEAQVALVSAGKIDATDPTPFHWLGEVLLRRGDAVRAERVLTRALDLGGNDAATRALHARAVALTSLQQQRGAGAVAGEVARSLRGAGATAPGPNAPSLRSVGGSPSRNAAPLEPPTRPREGALPRFGADDVTEISDVHELSAPPPEPAVKARPRAAPGPSTNGAKQRPPPMRAREPSGEEITHLIRNGESLPSFDQVPIDATDVTDVTDVPSFDDPITNPGPSAPVDGARLGASQRSAPPAELPPPRRGGGFGARSAAPAARSAPTPIVSQPALLSASALPASARAPAPVAQPFMGQAPRPAQPSFRQAPPLPAFGEASLPSFAEPGIDSAMPTPRFDETLAPSPALVLEHLSRVGIFERGGGAPPAWEAAPRQKARGVIPLALAILLLAGAGAGSYSYARHVKAERAMQAAVLNAEVDKLLHSGKVRDLKASDQKLSQAFELDSRSQRAARQWLENRVLGALLIGEEPRGIDSAVYRGRTVGLPEKSLAVGRVASFLVDGDLAGAAAMLPKWDESAGSDAYYQLAAGAVLERAGDERALERYDAARRLDPRLLPADVLLARLLLLQYGIERARPALDELKKKAGDQPMVRALEALSWVIDPERPAALPDSAKLTPEEGAALPAPLASVPAMVEAMESMGRGEIAQATSALDRAITSAGGPVLATSLGFLAIETGSESLARKAALRALSFAALYPRARTLAARVALLGGRLDEAQKAVEELDPKAPDVAIVRAVVAYETGEASDLLSALDVLGPTLSAPNFAGLAASPAVLLGTKFPDPQKLEELASPLVPWGELIAIDAALDTGNIALAERLLTPREEERRVRSPVYELRFARLLRYQKKLDEALAASERAFVGKPTAASIIERVYELLDKEQLADAKTLVAKYPALLGPLSGWFGVLFDVAANQSTQAAVRLTKLEPPPDEAPTVLRVLVARSLAVAKDKRARPYVFRIARKLPRHPDVLLAAEALK